MDVHTSHPLPKNQKLLEGHSAIENEDRISNLPDVLLFHILSFLPTHYAFRTSILSTRWKYIWTFVPNLDFGAKFAGTYTMEDDQPQFVKFVDRALILHNVQNLQRFRLLCRMKCTESRINSWISTAVMRNVQELDLDISADISEFVEEPFLLPCSLFSCQSLRVLKLRMCYSVTTTPASVFLPSLKILDLDGVVFDNENSIKQFFSGCPVLEELTVCEYTWGHKSASISLPALKKLTIFDIGQGLTDGEITISAPNLLSLNYTGAMPYIYSLNNLSSILDANIVASGLIELPENIGPRACKLLSDLSGVQGLTLCDETIQNLCYAEDLLAGLPTFCKLTYLDLKGNFDNCLWDTLMIFLKNCPILESIVFSEGLDLCENCDINDFFSLAVPQCLISSIKEVKFMEFCGMEHELALVSFLLASAVVLKKMTIIYSKELSVDFERQALIKEQAEFVYNNSIHSAVGFSPFQIVIGYPNHWAFTLSQAEFAYNNSYNSVHSTVGFSILNHYKLFSLYNA